jgi:uncharacterized protein YndB with AHSA1/START domain
MNGEAPMTQDSIENMVLLGAAKEKVWSIVSTAGFWAPDEKGAADKVAIEGMTMVTKNADLGEMVVRVERVKPLSYISYRWTSAFPGEELRENNTTLVEFTLDDEGRSTWLKVKESGFASLDAPQEVRDQAVRFNTEGWPLVFDMVKSRISGTQG